MRIFGPVDRPTRPDVAAGFSSLPMPVVLTWWVASVMPNAHTTGAENASCSACAVSGVSGALQLRMKRNAVPDPAELGLVALQQDLVNRRHRRVPGGPDGVDVVPERVRREPPASRQQHGASRCQGRQQRGDQPVTVVERHHRDGRILRAEPVSGDDGPHRAGDVRRASTGTIFGKPVVPPVNMIIASSGRSPSGSDIRRRGRRGGVQLH